MMYCGTHMVGSGLLVDEFFGGVLCFTAVPGTTYCCIAAVQDGWFGGRMDRLVGVSMG